jgi:hypothetical protein
MYNADVVVIHSEVVGSRPDNWMSVGQNLVTVSTWEAGFCFDSTGLHLHTQECRYLPTYVGNLA